MIKKFFKGPFITLHLFPKGEACLQSIDSIKKVRCRRDGVTHLFIVYDYSSFSSLPCFSEPCGFNMPVLESVDEVLSLIEKAKGDNVEKVF